MIRRIIPTKELVPSSIPTEKSDLELIFEFALTFDIREAIGESVVFPDPSTANESMSLEMLRAILYVTQRRWNHMGTRPDPNTEKEIRKLIGLIRSKY